jgi:hypothetical protein
MLLLIHCGYGLGQSPLIGRDRNHALKDRLSQREPLIMSAIREAPGAQEEAQETRQKKPGSGIPARQIYPCARRK